jgi:hypothetical protein
MFHVEQFRVKHPHETGFTPYFPLFPNTKIGKNNVQQSLDIHSAGQPPQSARGQPQVFGGQFQPARFRVNGAGECRLHLGQDLLVALAR